jgi:hypothetical protein
VFLLGQIVDHEVNLGKNGSDSPVRSYLKARSKVQIKGRDDLLYLIALSHVEISIWFAQH